MFSGGPAVLARSAGRDFRRDGRRASRVPGEEPFDVAGDLVPAPLDAGVCGGREARAERVDQSGPEPEGALDRVCLVERGDVGERRVPAHELQLEAGEAPLVVRSTDRKSPAVQAQGHRRGRCRHGCSLRQRRLSVQRIPPVDRERCRVSALEQSNVES